MTSLDDIAKAIWRDTYRHDSLLEWHEIKRGTLHHKRVMAAAEAVRQTMTQDEQKALILISGGLELLRNAIVKGDPYRELEFRVRFLMAETQGVIDGKAATVAQFKYGKLSSQDGNP